MLFLQSWARFLLRLPHCCLLPPKLGVRDDKAKLIYGPYTSLVYITPVLGSTSPTVTCLASGFFGRSAVAAGTDDASRAWLFV